MIQSLKYVLPGPLLLLASACVASAGDFATEVLDATCKLFNPDSTATCFLVKREAPDVAYYVVTAAHVLEKAKGETSVLVLREAKADGAYERKDHTISIRDKTDPLWVRHPKEDVAVLRLTKDLPVPVRAIPVSSLASETQIKAAAPHVCSPLFLFTFPQRFEANSAGFPVARHGIFASPPLLPMAANPTFQADVTTFAGDSGGPVFMENGDKRPLIVGIMLAQSYHDERFKTEYEEVLIHHPLGMGTVLHAQFVIETLDACAKKEVATAPGTR